MRGDTTALVLPILTAAEHPSLSMAWICRKLTDADIVALRDAKLAKDSSAAFEAAWPGHQWVVSGEQLPEVSLPKICVWSADFLISVLPAAWGWGPLSHQVLIQYCMWEYRQSVC